MPQDITFDLPFPVVLSPDLEGSRRRNLEWVERLGLVRPGPSLRWYASWDMPGLAAHGMPYARAAGLDLCADAMAFFFVFDDQFDGPLGRDPARAADVCQKLIDIVHGAPAGPGADPCSRAFADLWTRSCAGAHPGWIARTAHEWEYYLATQAHEAIGRIRGTPGDMETYLQVRRGIAGTALPLSLGERAAGIDILPSVFHSPQLRLMRDIAVDVTMMCNDVYSLEKEEARGDIDNLVLVIQHAERCTREEAVSTAREEVARRTGRFKELEAHVLSMGRQLHLKKTELNDVRAYVDVMALWMSGYHAWQTQTRRYTAAPRVLPSSGPGYFDAILPS
ncbi:terpene cyclase [Streptomyces sp. NBC_00687]|uniref:terpene synthase family protein n=1 Tax=Streptomyces sp. NBC_00687 TaxID=2975807 RepID=UPI002256EB71|nr:terpene cyclase [Streptomyces sp. NBC_00687]MCX4919744.1 terpene cyclase [Streptomyces sp. NBC_00687]